MHLAVDYLQSLPEETKPCLSLDVGTVKPEQKRQPSQTSYLQNVRK